MLLIRLFISTMLICKFLAAVSHASISLIYSVSERVWVKKQFRLVEALTVTVYTQ
jgi:hypothetical protein